MRTWNDPLCAHGILTGKIRILTGTVRIWYSLIILESNLFQKAVKSTINMYFGQKKPSALKHEQFAIVLLKYFSISKMNDKLDKILPQMRETLKNTKKRQIFGEPLELHLKTIQVFLSIFKIKYQFYLLENLRLSFIHIW